MGSNTSTVQNTPTAVNAPFQSNQTTDLVRGPYPPVAPAVNSFIDQASQISNAGYTPSATPGAMTPQFQNAFDAAQYLRIDANAPWANAVQGMSNNGVTAAMQPSLGSLGQIASGANSINTGNLYQQLFNNLQPTAGGALNDTQNAILEQNAARLGDQLASKYSGAGRYGSFGAGIGTARGIAETNNPLIAQFQQQNIGNSLSALGGLSNVQQQNIGNQMNAAGSQLGAYNQAGQRATQWAALAPQMQQVAMMPAQTQLALSQGLWGSPWTSLGQAGSALSSMAPLLNGSGTQTGTQNTSGFQTNTPTGTSTTSQPTPWTTYAGLGLAGIGALSDRRMKTDIKKVGRDPWTALNMYQFRYKGQPKNTPKFVGPMAQEVREKFPEAVGELPGGILYIKKAA